MNPKEKIKFISNWIKSYAEGMPSKAKSLVIGISGGIDSSVSSTLSAMDRFKNNSSYYANQTNRKPT